jgi:hypothetical protein
MNIEEIDIEKDIRASVMYFTDYWRNDEMDILNDLKYYFIYHYINFNYILKQLYIKIDNIRKQLLKIVKKYYPQYKTKLEKLAILES